MMKLKQKYLPNTHRCKEKYKILTKFQIEIQARINPYI